MVPPFILASGSEIRAEMLRNAGLKFSISRPRVDETSILAAMQAEQHPPRDIADALAEAKARKVSSKTPEAYVLGCDQVLSLDDKIYQKPNSPQQARAHLEALNGRMHHLFSAAVIYQEGEPLWRHVSQVRMHMAETSEEFRDAYLERNWHSIQHAVGCYKIEEEGISLFRKIDGDYFAILGLPLLELLGYFRLKGLLPT